MSESSRSLSELASRIHIHDIILYHESFRDYGEKNRAEENGQQYVMLKGSLKEKFTLSFIINSTNLRMRDTIGEGWSK